MTIKIGVIADDFTGSTDIGCFIAATGCQVVQFVGTPDESLNSSDADALIISLKTRSCPVQQAIDESIKACRWLKANGCQLIYFKYCSTFDSTAQGNIGPVTDALLKELDSHFTLICPSLPVNGRTVVQGHLFVNGQLLNESGMQNHPITPMKDANLIRLMDAQSSGKTGLLDLVTVQQGANAITEKITQLQQKGFRYAVVDAMTLEDLRQLKPLLKHFPLLTGGSAFGQIIAETSDHKISQISQQYPSAGGRGVILSGSCSVMTNNQVARYQQQAPTLALDIEQCMTNPQYAVELSQWVMQQSSTLAPMVYATQPPEQVRHMQEKYGIEQVSYAVEKTFAHLARLLSEQGFNRFILAGGETSSLIVQELGTNKLEIGGLIAPGVPWVRDLNQNNRWLALKSGNFGDQNFFQHAQELCHD
ncbi:four-carbon acid sugar kinase family protein [Budviciaceae bacterium CWB-B4]|uniref:3-oxo-tetronate kinase n=1 Tax=Limnobaculum xujianqingii TaxID=2738837 RepID=A0A9D7FVB2_9GAMM|nr:3-oxo-tetronate kinase [Limnobaculum xujianqingii]MBK5074294.1 four-carbon acid sugar kinase family protein [Limnobaculum xujianqingii]MBK5177603.1 four-carbon acid sugar kinase family protein [Limnobaculum xujianqingii]